MELIKKQFKLKMTTGSTSNGIVMIPDTSALYSMKLLLKNTLFDWGFFDVYEDENATNIDTDLPVTVPYTVTGECSSRLYELKKFSTSNDINIAYFTSSTPSQSGVDVSLSTGNTIVYYISGITYIDDLMENKTTFSFQSSGYSSPDFINQPIIKDESKHNIVTQPEVSNDVFIIRQSISVFQNIYRLQDIEKIAEIERYAGGSKFNIVNNS